MRKLYYSFLLLISINGFSQQFTSGNIAVFVAAASTSNTTGSIVELNTITPGQAAVSTHAIDGSTMPNALRFSGSATSTSYLANSNDGTLLNFTGGNTTTSGSTNINTILPRGVGTFNSAGTFNLGATYTGANGNQTRCATSLNNTSWFIGDQGGLYSNSTSAGSPTGNFRSVKSFGGTVYVSAASSTGTVIQVSTISAPTGGTVTGLPGLANNANHQDFYLIQSGDNGNTYDILYVISATSNTAGTVSKFSLVSGIWTANGTYTTNFGGFGMAAKRSGSGAELFISTGQGALTANNVIKCTDAAGYNTNLNITTASNVILYTAAAGTIVKGVAFTPIPAVNLSVDMNSGTEAATTVITVTATASSAVSGNQTISLGVSGAGITAGDYNLSNATITILDGATTGTVTFTIVDDADVEGTETATLTISNPSAGIAPGTTITQNIIITDNDVAAAPTVNLSADVNIGTEAAATVITITATASSAVTGAQTISLGVSGTGITAGDYNLSNTVITIPDGGTSGSVTFTITDDAIVEGTETATLTISNPSPGIILGATTIQNISITDNDVAPTVNLSVSPGIASETGSTVVTVTATASSAVGGDQAVSLAVTGLGITTGDYSLSNTTITIPNGATTGSVTFTITDDADMEGPETATLTISIPSPGITLGSPVARNVNIKDNDVPLMRITEYMYNGSEFVEFTNIGNTAIDMTGWSFDDASRTAGSVSLSGFGTVQAGESVIFSEVSEGSFRSTWGICNGIKIVGGNNNNLSGSDEINLYNASGVLVDRITYSTTTGPQATGISAWVSALGLGANLHSEWTLSVVADAEASFTSASGGFIGSPGKSTRATVVYDPCAVTTGAPTIVIDVVTTTNFLDGGVATSPASPYAISGVINDGADPAGLSGIDFTIGDDITPVGSLAVTVLSSNTTVVPNANLVLTGSGSSRNLKITPAGVGYSTITVTVNDGTNNTSYIINYAASLLAAPVAGNYWHTGNSDASAVIALDDDYMTISDDEKNILFVFDRDQSGLPVRSFDYNQGNVLGLPDAREVDVESAVRSTTIANRIYWLGSLSNSSTSFEDRPSRNRLFALSVTGTGAATSFIHEGHYSNLRSQLINWGDFHGYNFTASAADGHDPKLIDGFNVEGMVFGPDNTTMYIGFRAPLVPTASRTKAVIAPVQNFETWFNNGSPVGNPVLGSPIELDLGGRGIRDLIRLSNGNYIILAGRYDEALDPAVYRWTGNAGDAASLIPSFNVAGLNIEGVMPVNEGGQLSLSKLQFISDNGSTVFYGDNIEAKDLPSDNFKKFRSDLIEGAGGVLPVQFEYFTANRLDKTTASLKWKTGQADNLKGFEILRSVNGRDFISVAVVPAIAGQNLYSYTDNNAINEKLYYHIKAIEVSNHEYLSVIRLVSLNAAGISVLVYPNPVKNNLFSITVNKTGDKTIQVYTGNGFLYKEFQFSEETKDINTSLWPKGHYFIRIVTKDGAAKTERLIVQ